MSDVKDLEPYAESSSGEPSGGGGADEPEVEIVSFGDEDDEAVPAARAGSATSEASARELDEMRERFLRLRADFENFRKRAERDREERVRRGVAESLRELLPVADNLARAATAQGSLDDVRLGVEMVSRQLAEALRRQGVEAIEAVGQPFDPQLHEAVAREESARVDVPTVVAELQKGYLHGDRLLRPAMVRVAMPASTADAAGAAADGEVPPEDAS